MATRLDKDHPNVDFNCRYFKTNIAINAVQICVCTAFALVPRKVLILQFCFSALNKGPTDYPTNSSKRS